MQKWNQNGGYDEIPDIGCGQKFWQRKWNPIR